MVAGGVALPADASSEVLESIEVKGTARVQQAGNEDVSGRGSGGEDADADADAEGGADPGMDVDAEGEDDVEMMDAAVDAAPSGIDKQAQAAASRAKRDLLHLIESTAHYLSSYEEDGIEIAGGFQRIPNRRTIPDYFDIIKEPTAFSTIRVRLIVTTPNVIVQKQLMFYTGSHPKTSVYQLFAICP